jgi:DNA excision repair protein ERCC-2
MSAFGPPEWGCHPSATDRGSRASRPGHPARRPAPWTIAVRALCEFTARRGDLDLRFTPSPTGAEGVEGHGAVTARRAGGLPDRGSAVGRLVACCACVAGPTAGTPSARRLEEIKTYRGDLAHVPENHRQLHWAQARIYGALICRQLAPAAGGVGAGVLQHRYPAGDRRSPKRAMPRQRCRPFFEDQCRHFHRVVRAGRRPIAPARDAALKTRWPFPMPAFRTGQRELAEAVYRAARAGRCLMAQAPTGIGKTVGTLFPLLQAPRRGMRARPGKRPGQGFLSRRQDPRPPAGAGCACGRSARPRRLRNCARARHKHGCACWNSIARDKACEHPDKACHGESCPLARGFYDRLSAAARQAAVDAAGAEPSVRDKAAAREIAVQPRRSAPTTWAQELARWADVVVGDYNYWFDTSALLFAMTQDGGLARGSAGGRGAQPGRARAKHVQRRNWSRAHCKALRRAADCGLSRRSSMRSTA